MITSRRNKQVQQILHIQKTQTSAEQRLFIVEGPNLVEEAAKAGFLTEVFSTVPCNYNYTLVNDSVMRKMSTTPANQGLIGVCIKKEIIKPETRVLLLELNNPGNLGALIRSAVAFNFDTIYCVNNAVSYYNDKVLRASQGALFKLNLVVGSYKEALSKYEKFIWYRAELKGDRATSCGDNLVLCLGHETKGINKEIKAKGQAITVPIKNFDSLNVAIAGSILMYELGKFEK